jgi:alginate O-acetyltransferase complex protein AlgI
MVFTTHIFVFYFLPLVLAVYYALPWLLRGLGGKEETLSQARNLWLLAMSYVFYGWWNPRFILLMFFVTAVNYGCGHFIARANAAQRERRLWLAVAVVSSLGTLGFFKYFMFVQSNVHAILAWSGAGPLSVWSIVLPVGISFYTFQALSYSVDVYRGDAPLS